MSRFSWSKLQQDVVIAANALADRAAMAKLRNAHLGRTLFLVGSGPSLKQMDLTKLHDGPLFMTVNNGFRMFAGARIPMHCVSDNACYEKFGGEIEQADIGTRFYRARFRALPAYQHGHPQSTVFVPYRKGGVLKRGFQLRAENGLGNDASVLIFAAQLAYHFGFSTVNVLGCDLDYSAPNAYAYAMTDADRAHEETAEVQSRRRAMVNANEEFAVARRHFEADGRQLINCGVGGKLETLPRTSFDQALSAAR